MLARVWRNNRFARAIWCIGSVFSNWTHADNECFCKLFERIKGINKESKSSFVGPLYI